ncbi:hypothetical protein GLYMA_18G127700v4 [Glycine max]|uniref:Uncharacterized protein n=2 Tax=Glycine subgen. Soja TaxID=1462606 RepID=K7MRQ1_SOYBN|nr:hypothetical protein JHK85_050801 [Glycine max]KAG5094486.1 hypothetical protein JHK84_050074 [Glycine max]KAH1154302.1 hypothetical protein GYH30_049814 [Glycine max]KRG99188.1 hypothetical protein GLYMA_18G127700v4 [Glycine max]
MSQFMLSSFFFLFKIQAFFFFPRYLPILALHLRATKPIRYMGIKEVIEDEQAPTVCVNKYWYDYFGYGQPSGKPSEQNTCSNIEATYKCLEESYGAKQEDIILYG